MAADLCRVMDAIDRAKGVNSGLDALVSLIAGCDQSNIPSGTAISELLWSIHNDLKKYLDEADEGLRVKR